MKKLFALILAGMMLVSATACTNEDASNDSENNNVDNSSTNKGDDGAEDGDDTDNIEQMLEFLKPEGWSENNYGAYIYDVWDEAFLPDCLPGPVDGIKVDQTTYKDYSHKVMNNDFSVGALAYDSYEDYREYGVSFYATAAQLDEYIAALKENGFSGDMSGNRDDEIWWEYHFSNNDGWYVYIFFNTNDDEDGDFDGRASLSVTDNVPKYAASVAGTPLPQIGVPEYDYTDGIYLETYNYDTGEMDSVEMKLTDSFPTDENISWYVFFSYYGVDTEGTMSYKQTMIDNGWTLESASDDGYSYGNYDPATDDYYSVYTKDGVYAVVNCYDNLELEIGFSDMLENITY